VFFGTEPETNTPVESDEDLGIRPTIPVF